MTIANSIHYKENYSVSLNYSQAIAKLMQRGTGEAGMTNKTVLELSGRDGDLFHFESGEVLDNLRDGTTVKLIPREI